MNSEDIFLMSERDLHVQPSCSF